MMSTTSNPTHPSSDPDRETLCALFDGELQGDAMRFAHRRLGHDVEWREAFGRWQLAGDVLRRDASGLAPADFAARVVEALEAERDAVPLPLAVGGAVGTARSRARRRWIPGAALAASVAVAALFVARPLSNPDAPSSFDASPQVADRAVSPAPPSLPQAPVNPASTETGLATVAAAAAVAEAPRRAAEQRQARRQAARSMGQSRQQMTAPDSRVDTSALALNDALPASDPFKPQEISSGAPEAQSRPWPRAVLPGYGTRNGYSVGYGSVETPSPSFYPFEPQLPETGMAGQGAGTTPEPPPRPH